MAELGLVQPKPQDLKNLCVQGTLFESYVAKSEHKRKNNSFYDIIQIWAGLSPAKQFYFFSKIFYVLSKANPNS